MGTLRRTRDGLVELVETAAPRDDTASGEGSSPGSVVDVGADAFGGDFESFYRRELPGIVVLARVLAGASVADDVAQETMLTTFRQWETVRGYQSPVGWVRTVCMRKAVSVRRRQGLERRVLRQLGSFRREETPGAGDDERFWQAVRALPLRQGQVVALHYGLDLPVAEVARTLGCAEGTVKAHLSRARASLATLFGIPEEVAE